MSTFTSITPSAPERNLRIADARVLGLDPPRLRRRLRHHALDRADEPLNQIDVVRRLIHDRAAVELPGSAPRLGVVVLLRPLPAHGDVRHVDPAEASLVDGALQQLNRRVEPVLLDDEEMDARVVARLHQLVGLRERDRHRLLGDDVLARARRGDPLRGVQSRRRADRHDVASAARSSISSSDVNHGTPCCSPAPGARARVDVADGAEARGRRPARSRRSGSC